MENNKTTIIIPALKNSLILKETISHCLKLEGEVDVIIVTDDKNNLHYNELANVKYIVVQRGMTMSKKRNIAAKKTDSKYLTFFDSDSFPASNNWILNAINCLKKDKNIYCVGGPDTSPQNQNESQHSVGLLKKSFLISGFRNHRKNKVNEMFVPELSSSNLFMEKNKYFEMEGMDENLYTGEDTDLFNRIIAKGYKLFYSPNVHAYHYDRIFSSFLIERYDRGMQSTIAIKSYIKNLIKKKNVILGDAYTSKTFRFEFLINPIFSVYILMLLFLIIFSKFSFFFLIPILFLFILCVYESLRLCGLSKKTFPFFLKLITCILICSFASLLLFFGVSINLKKYYRNYSDTFK